MGILKTYWHNDLRRVWLLQNKVFYIPFEQYEFTRLTKVRELMDEHMTYRKDQFNQNEEINQN
tara:strand:- start:474 stop:662 length:189 start_codon:yes stop_codon:yes gene_type:complete